MTSEAPHRPGQEPGEVSPGAGGPAPYGDHPAQQDNGYPGTPDLGWAPPPPAGRPAQPAPAWGATSDDQAPSWTPPGGQPANRGSAQVPAPAEQGAWGSAQVPPPAEPAAWGTAQPAAWATPEQNPPAWASAPASPSGEPGPPAWGSPTEQAAPAWAAPPSPSAPHGAQPTWAQPGEPSARGAAQVPAPATTPHETWATPSGQQQDDPNRSGGWNAPGHPRQDDDPARSGGWQAGPPEDHSGGWPVGAAAQQQDDPNRSGGWGTPPPHEQPAWGQPGEQAGPAWAAAEPPARAAAKVPVSGAPAENTWTAPPDDPARSGGWQAGAPTPQDDPARSGGWQAGTHDEDPDRSGGWAAGRAAGQDDPAPWPAQRPAIPQAEPWAPGEAWGRAAEAEEAPAYQPAPGPGISPANAVPLPPQEQRVPGAALAASPPADYRPPAAQFEPAAGSWGTPEPPHEQPQSPAGPVVPAPRLSPEGSVSASASVPMASRVTPPADEALRATGTPAPQPRVYGRPVQPEPEEAPGHGGPDSYPGQAPRFDEPGADAHEPHAFGEAAPVPAPPSSPAGPSPFPPGVPSFVDPATNSRPVNGVHPQDDERPGDPYGAAGQYDPYGGSGSHDPYGSPGHHDPYAGAAGSHDPYGSPGHHDPYAGAPGSHDPYGGPGHHDPYGAPGGQPGPYGGPGDHQEPFGGGQPDPFGGPPAARAAVGVPGQGPAGESGPGGFPPAFPPPPQQAPPAWPQPGPEGGAAPAHPVPNEAEQGRFDAFKPEAEPKTEAPTPKVRNGRVLAAVLIAAVLILAVPLGLLMLLGKIGGGNDKPAAFNPAVGSCVKQSGAGAVAAECGEQGAFTVVSKADSKDKCADPAQPHVVLPGDGANRVLCLKPAGS